MQELLKLQEMETKVLEGAEVEAISFGSCDGGSCNHTGTVLTNN